MKIGSFQEAKELLYRYIPKEVKQKFPGELGLLRTKYFLKLLGSPQNRIRVVHIAGTSGKGSTAYLTSIILKSLGFKVGLHLSPHLVDIRERIQIDNNLISRKKFISYLSYLIPFIEKVEKSKFGSPTYFEILSALAFYTYWRERVDYAVIETGLGGLYDATNTVSSKNKIVVLTRIGFDHTEILGNTIREIARQKAEIIKSGNAVVSIWQKKPAREVIGKIAKERNAKLFFIRKGVNYRDVRVSEKETTFNLKLRIQNSELSLESRIKDIKLGLIGFHQAENASLALATVSLLSHRNGFKFGTHKIRNALKNAYFPGRFEIKKIAGKTIVIDGAHNPQKMKTLVSNLKKIWPSSAKASAGKPAKKFVFLVAFKTGKDFKKMLSYIVPLAEKIIITSFFVTNQDLLHLSENPVMVAKFLEETGFRNVEIIRNPDEALKTALRLDSKYLVITGSFYFIGEIYAVL